jgi:putative nucleotidyltransferase with HDIG domain/PAS domain S-box-containing protein
LGTNGSTQQNLSAFEGFDDFEGLQGKSVGELASLFGIPVVTLDSAGRGLSLNSQWRAWAPSDARAAGREWIKAFDPRDQDPVEATLNEARLAGSASIECRFAKRDGTTAWVLLRIFAMRGARGALEGFVAGASDITRIREMAHRNESAAVSTIGSLSKMEALRDPSTAGHQKRVGRLAEAIGAELGMAQPALTGLRIAATLHDIGKVGTPLAILTKPARLTKGEMALVREHAANGYAILKDVTADWPVARVAYEHHERLDGSGYPQGLRGDAILLEARITAVADVVESMSVQRPYCTRWGMSAALQEIHEHKGQRYDPDVVEACVRLIENGLALYPAAA